jgi:predicted transcriptional regulator
MRESDIELQNRPTVAYMQSMTQPAPADDHIETEAEQQARLAWEAEGIAKARASTAAGYYATSAEVNAWIDSLGTDNPLPVPYPRHPRAR